MFNAKNADRNNYLKEDVYRELQKREGCATP